MSEKDKELIKQAEKADDWHSVIKFEDQAESAESKRIIHTLMVNLYRAEEYAAGLL